MNRIVQGKNKKCKFGCIYCFTKENYETNGQQPLNDVELEEIELIQPFSDYDVFACEDCDWENEINMFSQYEKILSFATKAYISDETACKLSDINKRLQKKRAFLHVGISITTIKYIKEVEPRTSSFECRVESLKNLCKYNIPCSVIFRPVLPILDCEDIEKIVSETYQYCNNYIIGPLYLNRSIQSYLEGKGYEIIGKPHSVNWRKGTPICNIYRSDKQETDIIMCCERYGKKVYSSNSNAVENIKKILISKLFEKM